MHTQPDTHMPRGAKTYIALLTQSGTNAPTANVLSNTLGDIVWTRDDIGLYTGTLTGAFKQNKTFLTIANNWGAGSDYALYYNDADTVAINTGELNMGSFQNDDDQLNNTSIQITVY